MKGFIFDLDGTVYVDNKIIDGAAEAINHLRERGDKVVFLTNKSIESISSYVDKLNRLGIEATMTDVVNSNLLAAKYLASVMKEEESVLVIGEQPLYDELNKLRIPFTEDPQKASYVVLGWDREFTYEKINQAFQAWSNGAQIVATNPDRTCPVHGGRFLIAVLLSELWKVQLVRKLKRFSESPPYWQLTSS
ncbi:4-nitrophenylphosphatase [Lentibacillus sp. JNUCC-1]|uniref:HAD-IIA family hydrolase n=1 Tax=Lentibacillus sp. JNUCC-1 TaxID=2654513 RepID=UPI00132B1409|nr:4-nitrophenylphosphatase [Lentibacillus sp. JNUCC-1]